MHHARTSLCTVAVLLACPIAVRADEPVTKITHSFLATGGETFLVDGAGKVTWSYPHSTRDGWVLSTGNILLAVGKDRRYPGGAAIEVTRAGKVVFEFKGTQSEVNTVEALENGNILLTEAGAKPRLLEVERKGKIVSRRQTLSAS